MSLTGFTYEKNNFTALVDFEEKNTSYHTMMRFFQNCKLSKAMFEGPTLYFEVIEAIWESAVFDSVNATITFVLQGKEHVINSDIISACLNLPNNSRLEKHSDTDIVNMLNLINYVLLTDNLSKIQRKGMVKEWSFFFDAILKVFSGKISNYDAVTFSMLDIAYMLLSDSFYNLGSLILYELGAKLGNKASRTQEAQVSQVISSTVPTSVVISLISSATMEARTIQQPPTQVATSRIPKSKSRKPTSGASQKAPVAKTTQALEGSVKEVVSGEGRGEHQRNPKNEEGEISVSQPSHPVSSQKDAVVEKESITSLVTSSQKDVVIEKSPQPGTHHKRDRDTRIPTDTTMAYTRRKRSKQSGVAQGSHTVPMAPSQIQFDVAPVNVVSQPHSLFIQTETETPSSPTLSLDVDMIHTSIPGSPSLTFLEKPHSEIGGHHLIDDLLDHQSIISQTLAPSVSLNLKSISTDSALVSTSRATSFFFINGYFLSVDKCLSVYGYAPNHLSIDIYFYYLNRYSFHTCTSNFKYFNFKCG
ncbi:hypothetical protein POM88_002761 [Heracleum sosnowskyi]|uniref:Uncharacterized protein n=1 Tax=Heracleum sosnowskyi TaxID=360622 RepID=A0AAD8NCA4_9APIA|nr:hypothetical protein POM88_002761 [Heracleum sosnowskyi]